MKILLDSQIYNLQKYGGISRYYTEVFSILSNNKNLKIIIPLNNSNNILFNQSILMSIKQRLYNRIGNLLKKLRLRNIIKIEKFKNSYVRHQIKQQKYDLFVPTYYDTYFLNHIGSKPFVLTVYDMIHELFPEYYTNDKKTVFNKLLLMEKANRIIAVSENTKNDILKLYPHINSAKIDVVYHGCPVKNQIKYEILLPNNYILFVGERIRYKNFIFLLNSIYELLKNDSNLFLVCAGGGDFSIEEKNFIGKLGIEKQIIQMNFKEGELGEIYNRAKCFVFPSEYEGFGLPILEAMIYECPVVLTNNSSFPEVAGNAGVYYELYNSNDLKNKIELFLSDDTMRYEYILKGNERVKKFSWEKASNECLEVYKKVFFANEKEMLFSV